ncbi:hypothetical protein HK101_009027 [Irineochytrium annulatum]|nr:hypothetical protein HK101_009027 [Irineochytrium annulatum]
MFELTGTLTNIIPCMVTLMVAKLIGDAFGKGGLTDVQIQVKGFPFLDGTEDEIVGSPAHEWKASIGVLSRFQDMFKKLGPRYITVQAKGRLQGLITKKDLLRALHERERRLAVERRALALRSAHSLGGLGVLAGGMLAGAGGSTRRRMSEGDTALPLIDFEDEDVFGSPTPKPQTVWGFEIPMGQVSCAFIQHACVK